MSKQLTEAVTLEGIVAEGNTLKRVKVLGESSVNGRRYPRTTRTAAVAKFEGARVYLNHPSDHRQPRGYQERVGTLHNIEDTEEGLFADFTFNPKHPIAEQLQWEAQHPQHGGGLSINVMATAKTDAGIEVIESIETVKSVDLVAEPATALSLFESKNPPADPPPSTPPSDKPAEKIEAAVEPTPFTLESLSLAQLTEGRPDLVQEMAATVRAGVTAALKALMDSDLNYHAWDAGLIDQILSADESKREQIIADRQALTERIAESVQPEATPQSTLRHEHQQISTTDWAKSLKRP